MKSKLKYQKLKSDRVDYYSRELLVYHVKCQLQWNILKWLNMVLLIFTYSPKLRKAILPFSFKASMVQTMGLRIFIIHGSFNWIEIKQIHSKIKKILASFSTKLKKGIIAETKKKTSKSTKTVSLHSKIHHLIGF